MFFGSVHDVELEPKMLKNIEKPGKNQSKIDAQIDAEKNTKIFKIRFQKGANNDPNIGAISICSRKSDFV